MILRCQIDEIENDDRQEIENKGSVYVEIDPLRCLPYNRVFFQLRQT